MEPTSSSRESFSLDELRLANKVNLPATEVLTAADGNTLSYRRYTPASPCAVVLFYHGGGAHSAAGYQYLGNGLQTQFGILVYMPDIRGHGASGGPRGDAPSPKQVWEDMSVFIKHIRTEYPQLPLFLGGHSSGAGLALNYIGQPDHELVAGYIFLSPQLGIRSQTERPALAHPFASVDVSAFIDNAASGGVLHGHDYAVRFNYPTEVLASDPRLIASITVNMSNALTPSAPFGQFATLDRPFGLWIGAQDELFQPDKVIAFADLAVSVRAYSQAEIIPGAKHLSILVNAHEIVGPWIEQMITVNQLRGL